MDEVGNKVAGNTGSVRHKRRVALPISVIALTVLSLAACSSSKGSGGSSGDNGKQVVSATDLATFKASFADGQKVPEFKAPGEPISNPESLRGAKIMVIPVTSKLLVCEQIGKQLEAFAPQMGMTAKTWDNEGQPSQWASGIQAAIQGKYKAIIFACGVNPKSVVPQLEAAKKAGITVVTSNGGDTSLTSISPLLYGITTSDQIHYQQKNVEAAFVQSDGKAHDALIVTSNENVQAPPVVKAIQDKYQSVCGSDCNVQVANVAIPDWSTKIQSSVQATLVAHPNITAVYCIYAGQAAYAVPAVQASHRSDVSIYTYGGDTGPIEAAKSSKIIATNWAASPAWSAYQAYYQTFRGMTGLPALPPAQANAPYRDITPTSAVDYLDPSGDGGYGTAFVNGFRELFGLQPLAGAELIKAAKAGR
jgi:ribose transport system substrate-binding protein